MRESSQWDLEYQRKGIPSSNREEPSGALRWALHNWRFLSPEDPPARAIDVGCGTGRNTRWLAAQGIDTVGLDWSGEAIARAGSAGKVHGASFLRHDITDGLPYATGSADLAVDTFVYFHQVEPSSRQAYLEELRRVLRPGGVLLMSLATDEDGYYRQCPAMEGYTQPKVVLDPIAGVRNVLFEQTEFLSEVSRVFTPAMTWRKTERGEMHGQQYERVTVAALFSTVPRR